MRHEVGTLPQVWYPHEGRHCQGQSWWHPIPKLFAPCCQHMSRSLLVAAISHCWNSYPSLVPGLYYNSFSFHIMFGQITKVTHQIPFPSSYSTRQTMTLSCQPDTTKSEQRSVGKKLAAFPAQGAFNGMQLFELSICPSAHAALHLIQVKTCLTLIRISWAIQVFFILYHI